MRRSVGSAAPRLNGTAFSGLEIRELLSEADHRSASLRRGSPAATRHIARSMHCSRSNISKMLDGENRSPSFVLYLWLLGALEVKDRDDALAPLAALNRIFAERSAEAPGLTDLELLTGALGKAAALSSDAITALEDGRITKREVAEIKRSAADCVRNIEQLLALFEERCEIPRIEGARR